jgi:broad specificity phosphatase PhoE
MVDTLVGRTLDVDLSSAGRAQLPALVERIRPARLAAIYCSPRRRTRETAQAIAMGSGVPLVIEPAFDEVDFGTWSGCTFTQLQQDPQWHRWNGVRDVAHAPHGESISAVQARAVQALERLAIEHPEQNVAIVSHGEIVRSLLLHYLGLPLQAYTRMEVSPASRSLVELARWGSRVLTMNEHSA